MSDSGTVPEEGAYFKFPAVSVRTSTERPEAMDQGVFTIGSISTEQVLQAVELVTAMYANGDLAAEVPCYQTELCLQRSLRSFRAIRALSIK